MSDTNTIPARAIEDRCLAIGEMIRAARLAETEMRKAAGHVMPHIFYTRNRVRIQAVGVMVGDLVRELNIELRKAQDALCEAQGDAGSSSNAG